MFHQAAIAPDKLAIAQDVKAVASVAAQVWPEAREQGIKLELFACSGDMTVNSLSVERGGAGVEQA